MWNVSAASRSCRLLARQRRWQQLQWFIPPGISNPGSLISPLHRGKASNQILPVPVSPDHPSAPTDRHGFTIAHATQNQPDVLTEKLIDFHISAKIVGDESHVVMVELQPGETLRAESGAMIFMTEGIVMDTKLNGASSALSRMLTGQNVFLTDFRYEQTSGTGTVCLGTDFPSKILRLTLSDHPEHALICQKGAYLASNPNVDIAVQFTKSFTAGFFGGQGFVLQKLSGHGDILVKGGGTIVTRHLSDGESLRVTSGSIVALETTIQYDVQMMPGITNAMFGGEGLFVTTLTGPGTVWLQGLPPDRMIAEIARRVPSGGSGIGLAIPLGIGGGGGSSGGGDMDTAASAATGGAAEMAVESDRLATVASSGMPPPSLDDASLIESDTPSALFGDVSGAGPIATSAPTSISSADDSDPYWEPTAQQPSEDNTSMATSSGTEPSFDDDFSFDSPEIPVDPNDGELFDDTVLPSEEVAQEAKGLFRQLWDYFSDQD